MGQGSTKDNHPQRAAEIEEPEDHDEDEDVKPPIEAYSTGEPYFHSPNLKESYESRHLNNDLAFATYE